MKVTLTFVEIDLDDTVSDAIVRFFEAVVPAPKIEEVYEQELDDDEDDDDEEEEDDTTTPLDFRCPRCGAAIGASCRTNAGKVLKGMHVERTRLLTRS
jgi:hypothetical protein